MKRLFAILAAGALLLALPGSALAEDEVFSGQLRGSNETPPVAGNASGTAYVFINEAGTEVKYAVSYTGLTGPLNAAHIHIGAVGVAGPIALPLTIGPSTMFGTLTSADFQTSPAAATWDDALDAIRDGRAYVNLHTSAHPAGEIRAQLAPAASGPSPSATAAATTRPTATAAATGTTPAGSPTPPPTSTVPESSRGTTTDLAPVLVVLVVSILSGGLAVWKLQPARRTRDDWD